ncbi:hypothetical protein [Nocardia harenae]|uniref:hypothetical protein n=1 Tax=Nocardia harenae TaxID=358707 RepID=UPI00082D41EC|nr:hypothetical protein [Nocardia harenae]
MAELTEITLEQVRNDFAAKYEELKKTPDTLNHAVDQLKYYTPLIYLKVTEVRDDIQQKLAELFDLLDQAVEGMYAPWLFLNYAAKWQAVGGRVRDGNGMQGRRENNMEGRWDGSAYKAFKTTKESQQAAMVSIDAMCTTMHDRLVTVAEEGQNLYYNLVNKLASIIGSVATFAAETSATAGAAAIWTINNLNDAIVKAVELVAQALTDFVKVQSKVYGAANDLKKMIVAPAGFDVASSGKVTWPSTAAEQYDSRDDGWKQDGAA